VFTRPSTCTSRTDAGVHDHWCSPPPARAGSVGCALLVKNPVKAWWGEGDEKFWSTATVPSTFGTGTETNFG